MPALTIKNIPDELYNELKVVAERHHRSLNSEIIVCLSNLLLPKKLTPAQQLADVQNIRAQLKNHEFSETDIFDAINEGRP